MKLPEIKNYIDQAIELGLTKEPSCDNFIHHHEGMNQIEEQPDLENLEDESIDPETK